MKKSSIGCLDHVPLANVGRAIGSDGHHGQADPGQRLCEVEQNGSGVRGGSPGDLFVVVRVRRHKLFRRHDDDLLVTVPVSFADAALGATVEVPTLDARESVKLKAGSENGTRPQHKNRSAEIGSFIIGCPHVEIYEPSNFVLSDIPH